MHDYLAQCLLHAALTVAVVEPLLRLWRLSDPSVRLGARLGALAVPILLTPALLLAVPDRQTLLFRLDRAWFDSQQWHAVTVAGVGMDEWAVVAACVVGLALLGRDLRAMTGAGAPAARGPASPVQLERVARVAAARNVTTPVVVIADDDPQLFVRGSRQPRIVVSDGGLARLDDEELGVALAHERAHVIEGDIRLGWWLGAARVVQAFNPFVHVLAHAAIAEMERRADVRACRTPREVDALARARARLLFRERSARADFGPAVSGTVTIASVPESRDPAGGRPRTDAAAVTVALLSVSVLAYFVV